MTRSLLCIVTLLCAFAAPAAALAQGAGDEQYQDPFGEEQSEQPDPAPAPTTTPAPAQAPSAPAPTATPSAAQAAPAAPAPAPSGQLPRTGAEAAWLALAGAVLLATGLALRRRADREL